MTIYNYNAEPPKPYSNYLRPLITCTADPEAPKVFFGSTGGLSCENRQLSYPVQQERSSVESSCEECEKLLLENRHCREDNQSFSL